MPDRQPRWWGRGWLRRLSVRGLILTTGVAGVLAGLLGLTLLAGLDVPGAPPPLGPEVDRQRLGPMTAIQPDLRPALLGEQDLPQAIPATGSPSSPGPAGGGPGRPEAAGPAAADRCRALFEDPAGLAEQWASIPATRTISRQTPRGSGTVLRQTLAVFAPEDGAAAFRRFRETAQECTEFASTLDGEPVSVRLREVTPETAPIPPEAAPTPPAEATPPVEATPPAAGATAPAAPPGGGRAERGPLPSTPPPATPTPPTPTPPTPTPTAPPPAATPTPSPPPAATPTPTPPPANSPTAPATDPPGPDEPGSGNEPPRAEGGWWPPGGGERADETFAMAITVLARDRVLTGWLSVDRLGPVISVLRQLGPGEAGSADRTETRRLALQKLHAQLVAADR